MIPFAGHLGIEVSAAEPEEVRGGMDWAPEKCTAAGVLHGGALMAFADTLGGVSAFLNLPDGGATTATVESKTNFFRAVREGRWRASPVRSTSAGASSSSRPTSTTRRSDASRRSRRRKP